MSFQDDHHDNEADLADHDENRLEVWQRQTNSPARATGDDAAAIAEDAEIGDHSKNGDDDAAIDFPPSDVVERLVVPPSSNNNSNNNNDAMIMDENLEEDEALARRLQEEMDDDRDDPELAAQTDTDTNINEDEALARRLQAEMDDDRDDPELAAQTDSDTNIDEDEALARRLQEEMNDWDVELVAQSNSTIPTKHNDGDGRFLSTTMRSFDEDACRVTSGEEEGAKQARRIEQELKDAEIAQLLGRYERDEGARIRVLKQDRNDRSIRNRMFVRQVLVPLLCCGGVALTVVLLFVFGVLGTEEIPFLGEEWLDPWSDRDGTIKWESNGNGLDLEVLNAMDESWQTVLETAVHNWDNGSPAVDPLTLTITSVPYERNCGAVTGKLKVCNGDYGKTRWRGLNEVVLKKGSRIMSSVAKMNDYYLKNNSSSPDEKLFTMCHEIGHGFGLPHSDEDFSNADLGNCMDYTKNLTANRQPDASNFEFLADLYGPYKSGKNATAVTESMQPPGRRLQSKLLQQEEGRRTLILHVNDYSELHWEALDAKTVRLYYYLLA